MRDDRLAVAFLIVALVALFGGVVTGFFQGLEHAGVNLYPYLQPVIQSYYHGLTIHGAGPNMTPRRRRAMTCSFMPVGSVFNGRQNVLPDDYAARLEPGDELDDDAHNPLLYRA